MAVTLYSRPGCELSQRIRELLREKGVEFDELEGERTVAVVDGVAIPGTRRAQIEQAIGWVGC
jgi:glutaredoxin